MRRGWKIVLTLAAALGIAAVAVQQFQAGIGTAILKRVVGERAGRDATKGLADGLHVALCGTGSPLPSPTRAGPCQVVIAGTHMFVVDAGEGAARNIALMGLPNACIEALFLTHFHSDHINGMGPMMMLRWTGAAASAPLPVYGPTGVERVMAGFNAAYATDNGYRTAHHGPALVPPSGAGAVAVPFALPPAGQGDTVVVWDKDGLKVTAFRVDHGPIDPAIGYRFDYKGRSVVISGDTKPVPSLVTAATGADLLIHEALQPKLVQLLTNGLAAKGINNTAQITRDILNYHTTPEEAARHAEAAGVRHLVLSHIVPAIPSRFFYPAFLGDAPSYFDGPITVGEDGMLFSLPAGTADIVQTKLM